MSRNIKFTENLHRYSPTIVKLLPEAKVASAVAPNTLFGNSFSDYQVTK